MTSFFFFLQVFSRLLTAMSLCKSVNLHAPFLSACIVDKLAQCAAPIVVSKPLQEILYPGIFGLFERCDSKQKKQMFSLLGDGASRALMMDLNEQFVETFKFVGK